MKITKEFLEDKNVLCAECLSDEFEILEDGKSLKCKKCGFESSVLDNSVGEYINKMNEFLNDLSNEKVDTKLSKKDEKN